MRWDKRPGKEKRMHLKAEKEAQDKGYLLDMRLAIERDLKEADLKRRIDIWLDKIAGDVILIIKIGKCRNEINITEEMIKRELPSIIDTVEFISMAAFPIGTYNLKFDY